MKAKALFNVSVLLAAFLSSSFALNVARAQTFYITVSPASQDVRQGQYAYYSITVYSIGGFNQTITLGTSALQTGLTASFNPSSVTPPRDGKAYASLTILASGTMTTGTYNFYVTGTSGGTTQQSAILTIRVFSSAEGDCLLYAGSTTIIAGGYSPVFVSATSINYFDGGVTFALQGWPSEITGSFDRNPIDVASGSSNSSTLTIYASPSAIAGTYYLAITGSFYTLVARTKCVLATVNVVIPDFSISANPPSRSIKQGESTDYTITVASAGGFSGTVTFSKQWVTTTPDGVDAVLGSTSVALAAYGSQDITLSITTTSTATIGTHKLRVTGTSGAKTHSVDVTLTVSTAANYTMFLNPQSQTVNRGSSTTFAVTVTSTGGFNKPVYLSLSGHQTGVTYDFNPNPVTPSAGGSATSTLTVYASATASLETRTLTITASAPDPGITHTATVSLTVAGKTDTSISCSLSVSTIRQGQNVTISGSITPNPGANNDVILEYSADGGSTWGSITTVKTDSAGSFSHVWSPGQGNYKVRSRWDGSATYNGATSSPQSLTVQPPGCVIATATYGSELSPEVQFLRGFRDGTVMATFAGSEFMVAFNAWYYSFSPYIADFISKQPLIKEAIKILLYPLIGILHISALTYSALSFSPELAIVATGLVASSLIGIIYFAPLSLITLLCMKRHRKFRLYMSHWKGLAATWIASIALICLAEATATEPVMMVATAMLVLSTLTLSALTTAQKVIQKLF